MAALYRLWIHGVVTVCFAVVAAPIFSGCSGGGGGGGGGGGSSSAPLQIGASVSKGVPLFDISVFVQVAASGAAADDATVTVNGTNIPNTGSGTYVLIGNPALNTWENVTLNVARGSRTVNVTLVMPEQPVVVAPTTAGGPYDASADLTVQWNAFATNPNQVMVMVDGSFTASGEPFLTAVPGAATSAIIPAGTLKSGTSSIYVTVWATNATMSLDSNAASGSSFTVAHLAISEPLNTH